MELRPIARVSLTRALMIGLLAIGLGVQAAPQAEARGAPDSFADLAERLTPAVVNISTSQNVQTPSQGNRPQLPPGSPFEDLFKDFFDQGPQQRGPRKVQSLGSGFVIDPQGLIVTNNHVIEDADEISIEFSNGTSLPATLLGRDPKTDLALLKVEPSEPLPFVAFGDSDAARVGDWVLAIGNPLGQGGSVSAGIISARNRDINAGPYDDFIQTDAAINRGNSGGPLFNMDGDVIGVNTAILSPTGGSIGIGFSVPATIAKNVVGQLKEFGQTRRGWLGVRIQQVTDELAEGLGLEAATGALVAGVNEEGPAGAAGIEPGDVILKFNGADVEEMKDLPRMVAETDVGSAVRVVVFRKGKTQTLKVTLGLLEEETIQNAALTTESDEGAVGSTLGMTLKPLSTADRGQFNIEESVVGVLISSVDPGGPAAEKNLQPGDVIVEVAQESVGTPADVEEKIEAARSSGRKSVLLLVSGRGQLRFVAVKLEG